MKRNSKLVKATRKFYRKLCKFFLLIIKKQILWLLRAFLVTRKQPKRMNAGFVLPTVAMVALVVVLLTTAILFRSFERSKNATNVRVNEVVLNASIPAIDRGKAKLNKLFQDRRLPRATPTDTAIESHFNNYINEYTFGDETPLKLDYEDTSKTPKATIELKSAWQYPVDTDNNGKFDSYTVYGIFFKNPPVSNGKYTRARNPLEARTPPMISDNVSSSCEDIVGTSATLVGNSGWFNISGKLKKAFFVYTATVPITQTTNLPKGHETYKGNKSFSALEYQQDRVQLPLVNNAVVYEDDISLAPGPIFNLNGRIITNSNFITGGGDGITLYQVSSKESCFYEADNGKIIVGGNLGAGGFTDDKDLGTSAKAHLFQGKGYSAKIGNADIKDNKSVKGVPREIAYNSEAYVKRISHLVNAQIAQSADSDPQEVKDGIAKKKKSPSYTPDQDAEIRQEQLRRYFERRTRRVPYTEVAFGGDALGKYASPTEKVLQGSGDSLRPVDEWIYPLDPDDGKTATDYAKLALNGSGKKVVPGATEPIKLQRELDNKEQYLGDRALIGNNLPELWWDKQKGMFVGPNVLDTQELKNTDWDNGDGTRTRRTRIEQLAELSDIERNGEWETAAAKVPVTPQDPEGGLRVVTSAGIYLPKGYTTKGTALDLDFSKATAETTDIWSDMMPVASATATKDGDASLSPGINLPKDLTPYLRMRATAVYHYKAEKYDEKNPKPIACVSSYYDPTDKTTAGNLLGLPVYAGVLNSGNSHNGIVYGPPTKTTTDYDAVLKYQAKLKYLNGRWVNEPLQKALAKADADRTYSEKSTIDATLCTLQILDKSLVNSPVIPHGAIKETAFLDARQIKAIHQDVTPGTETFNNADGGAKVPNSAEYDLSVEQRQPLEIRVTELDINLLRQTKIVGSSPQEYLVPNSGIIYATRDDALPDLSTLKPVNNNTETQKQAEQKKLSSVDFKLDPTRRPNAIMLINGEKVWRDKNYRDVEKGLIVASNLPIYIKGDFNLHKSSGVTVEEFTEALQDNWSNFYTRTKEKLNPNFACRPQDPRLPKCTTGDEWRATSILSDAVTLLSNNFRFGFRNEGDYDLNNNLGSSESITKFKQNGFLSNTYVTNAEWYDSEGYPTKDFDSDLGGIQGSSYLNNFVTPIQRRVKFHQYLMEVCDKLPVSECKHTDWKVDPSLSDKSNSWNFKGKVNGVIGEKFSDLKFGTTTAKLAADPKYQKYPRRVAFKRDKDTGALILKGGKPILLGIDVDTVKEYTLGDTNQPPEVDNALWFQTSKSNEVITAANKASLLLTKDKLAASPESQPILLPVLQNITPFDTPQDKGKLDTVGPDKGNEHKNWLQVATPTTFNIVAASGDTPARFTEDNGGLHNFVRFLENWNPTGDKNDAVKARINGSFIQIKRSSYATGPAWAFLTSGLEYPIAGNSGKAPYYIAPGRQWGYDVGLLSQSPDLFAQKLVRTPEDLPDEFFREVGRDDLWIKKLLCAKKALDNSSALDADQRPQNCN